MDTIKNLIHPIKAFNRDAIPPHDIPTEQSVLGCMILDEKALQIGNDSLTPEDFYNGATRLLFEELSTMAPGIDELIVRNTLRQRGTLERCGGSDGLSRMIMAAISAANVEGYIDELLRLSKARKALTAAIRLHSSIQIGGTRDGIQRAIVELQELEAEKKVVDFRAQLNQEIQDEITGMRTVLDIPFFHTMASTNCFLPGTVTCFCASPGASKSLWVLEAGWRLTWSGIESAILMLESGWNVHTRRFMAQWVGHWHINSLRWVHHNEKEALKIMDSLKEQISLLVEKRVLEIPEEGKRVDAAYLLRWIATMGELGKRFLVIDPITRMASLKMNKWAEQEKFMDLAPGLATKYKLSLIIVTHPKTGDKKEKAKISDENLAGLPDFRNFADYIFWLEKHASANGKFEGGILGYTEFIFNRTLHILKTRHGPGDTRRIGLDFSTETFRHTERGFIYDK